MPASRTSDATAPAILNGLMQGTALSSWYFPAVAAVFLIAVAQFSFLVFHVLAELFAIIISFLLFAFAWVTHRFSRNAFIVYLASGFFWIGALDLAHTLTYKGMGLLPVDEPNTATQIWLVTRYFQALLLLSAPFAARLDLDKSALFAGFGLIATLLLLWVASGDFPDAFIEGQGLTAMKVNSEYVIMAILAAACAAIWWARNRIGEGVVPLLLLSTSLSICTELAFTYYIDVYGFSNLVGHILKVMSFWAIFLAVIATNMVRPYLELAASNRAKDDFLASMSHDLRTPLNAVLGYSEMMRLRTFGPLGHAKYEEYIENIHASGTHLLGLVNDILDLSKLESDNYVLVRRSLDPATLTNEVMRIFGPDLSAKAIAVEVDCAEAAKSLFADERSLVQLLNNLVSNAIKFTPSGGKIGISWKKAPNGAITLTISDSGRGIPRDQIGRLTQRYFQVDPYVSQQKGTGLGLFIVRRIAELHGGSLKIASQVGRGTTVTVDFPAAANGKAPA